MLHLVEFKSSQELEDRLSESATLQGLVEDLQKVILFVAIVS